MLLFPIRNVPIISSTVRNQINSTQFTQFTEFPPKIQHLTNPTISITDFTPTMSIKYNVHQTKLTVRSIRISLKASIRKFVGAQTPSDASNIHQSQKTKINRGLQSHFACHRSRQKFSVWCVHVSLVASKLDDPRKSTDRPFATDNSTATTRFCYEISVSTPTHKARRRVSPD